MRYTRKTLPNDEIYWVRVEAMAELLETNGCSGPARLTQWLSYHLPWLCWVRDREKYCWEHDIHYRIDVWVDGVAITRREADVVYLWRHQRRSIFGVVTPMGWWRFGALRLFGWLAK